jgi:hypothetical protein
MDEARCKTELEELRSMQPNKTGSRERSNHSHKRYFDDLLIYE